MPVTASRPFQPPQSIAGHAGLPDAAPLSALHVDQLRRARMRLARVRRGVRVARFSGWTMCVLGGLAILTSSFGLLAMLEGSYAALPGFLVGVAITTCGVLELRGGTALRRLHPAAPGRLALNQLWIALALVGYSAAQLILTHNAPSSLASLPSQGDPSIDAILQDFRELETWIRVGLYATVATVAVLFSICTALFYIRRRAHLAAYRAETPGWIVALQEADVL
ncbi:MAG: hypothetical protein ACT4PL_06035 [Phycisphaerales bacterium]